MSFQKLLNSDIQDYIYDNSEANLGQLLLKKSPFSEITMQEIAQQIKGRQIAQNKFPFLLQKGIIFPPHLNLEQASSQNTAEEKANTLSGKSFLDLTCGFGIDAYFLSKNFSEITLIEQNKELSEMVKHNWETLGRKAYFINDNLDNFLRDNQQKFDVIYLDPARRDQNLSKKFLLEDLSPNLLDIQEKLLSISGRVIIKLSPLIDLKYLLSSIKSLEKIEIIAVKNEVKEVVLHLIPNFSAKTEIIAKNLGTNEPNFSFVFDEEHSAKSDFSEVLEYLYIPNNAVLKSGAFNLISTQFGLKKLHPNTHFYTSNSKIENFCGRIFRVKEISAKDLRKGDQYNIISKNHPLPPEQIKAKYKLKDGGENFLFFTQTTKKKIILTTI